MANNGKGEFWAFIAGVLTGGIVALLYAPARGKETREKVRVTSEDLREKGEEFYSLVRAEAEKLIATGKDKYLEVSTLGKEKYDESREKLDESKEKLEEAKEKGRKKIEEVIEKLKKEGKKPDKESAK